MKLGWRIALDLTAQQEVHFRRAAGCARFAWNWALSRWQGDWTAFKADSSLPRPSASRYKEGWAAVRHAEFPWSLDVTKCAGTQAILDLGATFARATKEQAEAKREGRKPRKMFGFPKFKSKHRTVPAFALWNDQFKLCNVFNAFGRDHATMTIPNLGTVRLREPIANIGGIMGARLSYRRGRWFVSFQFDTDWVDGEVSDKAVKQAKSKASKAGLPESSALTTRPVRVEPSHPAAGVVGGADVGLLTLMAVATGTPDADALIQTFSRRQRKGDKRRFKVKKRQQRKLARSLRLSKAAAAEKQLGRPPSAREIHDQRQPRLSNRQRKLAGRVARIDGEIADKRQDHLHQTSHAVAGLAEVMVVEGLAVANMMKNHALAGTLADASLAELLRQIGYKVEKLGGLMLEAPRFFPSSKRCSDCGAVVELLPLEIRDWTCSKCDAIHDRDANAGQNLRWLGLLAMMDDETSAFQMAGRELATWLFAARQRVANWRRRRIETVAPDPSGEPVGTACPEMTCGENAYRGGHLTAREMFAEPQTTPVGDHADRGGSDVLAHICSPCG